MWVYTYIFVVGCMCVCSVHASVVTLSVFSQVPLCLDQLKACQFGFTGWPANPRDPHVSTIQGLRLQAHTYHIIAFKNTKVDSENPIQVLMLIPQAFYRVSHFLSPYLAFDCEHFSRTVLFAGLVKELKWISTTFSVLGISVENFKSLD